MNTVQYLHSCGIAYNVHIFLPAALTNCCTQTYHDDVVTQSHFRHHSERQMGMVSGEYDSSNSWGDCVSVSSCMTGSLTSHFLWSRWRGKRPRHSRRMHNPQFYVSGKRTMAGINTHGGCVLQGLTGPWWRHDIEMRSALLAFCLTMGQ